MKIGFATMEQFDNREKDSVGSSRIRGRWLWESWNEPNDTCEQFVISKKYDTLIFQKVYWDNMMAAGVFDGVKILDICDPDWLEGKDVMRYINMCDACTTSSKALADYIQKFVSVPVIYVPDRIKLDEHTPRGEHIGKAKKIVWFGYNQNHHYLYPCLEALAAKGLELTVISNQPYVPPTGFDFIKIVNYTYTYPQVHEYIKQCDLYLAPEAGDEKGKFKSNNKALTAMALGVPVVSLPTDLERLMTAEARNEQMQKDLKEIKDNWDVKLSVIQMKEIINEARNKRG